MNKNIARRAAAAVSVGGAAMVALSSFGAGGAAASPLPGGFVHKTLADGTSVNVRLFDENVSVQRAVTNVQTSREVWASGKVKVDVGGKAKGAKIKAGYIYGCQVNFGAKAGGDAKASIDPSSGTASAKAGDQDVKASVTLGPGETKTQWIINATSGDDTAYKKYKVNDYTFTGKTGGVSYSQEKMGVDGCAGYAEGKAVVQVTVDTDAVKSVVTLYGHPFSLG